MPTTEPIPQRRRRRVQRFGERPASFRILSVLVVVLLIAGGVGIAVVDARGYFALVPGSAPQLTASPSCQETRGVHQVLPDGTPCVRISVPAERTHAINGSIYMVSVLVGRASATQYVLGKLGLLGTFDHGAQLVPAKAVLGTTPPAQLTCQAAQQMAGSTTSAALVALRRLGYPATEHHLGAQLYQVTPGSPAATAGLQCNDVVVAADGEPVHTSADLTDAIGRGTPGEVLRLTVQRVGTDGKLHTETLTPRLAAPPSGSGLFLGVISLTRTTYTFPFDISVDVGNIGGPSAGLALTLAILDLLSDGDLTGGHAVAATGTMETDGTVGRVGGVAQKALAVRRAGAKVFFVPAGQLGEARSEAGSMKVYAVGTLQEALDDLQVLGGHIPPPSAGAG